MLVRHLQSLCRHHRNRRAAAADVGVAFGDEDVPVRPDRGRCGRRPAIIAPVSAGDTAPFVGAQRGRPMRVCLGRFQALDEAYRAERHAGDRLVTRLHRVPEAQFDGIHAQLLGEFVHRALDRKDHARSARSAICRGVRHIGDDVPADHPGIPDPVHAKRRHHARMRAGTGEGPGVVPELDFRPEQGAILARAKPDLIFPAGRGAAGGKDFLPAHRKPHRAAGLAREQHGNRFEVDRGLATEAAADLKLVDADV